MVSYLLHCGERERGSWREKGEGGSGEIKLEAGILGPRRHGIGYHFVGALLGCQPAFFFFFKWPFLSFPVSSGSL